MENSPFPTSSSNETSGSAMARGVGSAGDALHSGINKVADPARQAVDRLSSAAHDTVEKVASSASQTASLLAEKTRFVTEVPVKMYESSRDWVKDRPMEAVGAALAIGFIFGRLTAR